MILECKIQICNDQCANFLTFTSANTWIFYCVVSKNIFEIILFYFCQIFRWQPLYESYPLSCWYNFLGQVNYSEIVTVPIITCLRITVYNFTNFSLNYLFFNFFSPLWRIDVIHFFLHATPLIHAETSTVLYFGKKIQ